MKEVNKIVVDEIFKVVTYLAAGAALSFSLTIPQLLNANKLIEKQRKEIPTKIVCESGSFETVLFDAKDPYLRETSTCNINSSEGPEIQVLVID